jgi:hypothetical protein
MNSSVWAALALLFTQSSVPHAKRERVSCEGCSGERSLVGHSPQEWGRWD